MAQTQLNHAILKEGIVYVLTLLTPIDIVIYCPINSTSGG
jgi:hypothetical protein